MTTATLLATLTLAATLHATPVHEAPRWYVARVVEKSAQQPWSATYGPWRGAKAVLKAEAFCKTIPEKFTCKAEPVLPASEWMRKDAR